MRHPKLDKITDILKEGKNFSLNRSQYIGLTGIDIPQQKSYVENKSAVAKLAEKYGYKIIVVPEVLEFHKISWRLALKHYFQINLFRL